MTGFSSFIQSIVLIKIRKYGIFYFETGISYNQLRYYLISHARHVTVELICELSKLFCAPTV